MKIVYPGVMSSQFYMKRWQLPFQENFTPFSISSLGLSLDSISMFCFVLFFFKVLPKCLDPSRWRLG